MAEDAQAHLAGGIDNPSNTNQRLNQWELVYQYVRLTLYHPELDSKNYLFLFHLCNLFINSQCDVPLYRGSTQSIYGTFK